ncbi:hypothetical protein [Reyranella sp.]|uniref:hypothetical protein n=1 Tax=Reyranella sp. TaxID=1929291 RepID=UPI002627E278|nr:hypothetical protein [Reyranella sp.]HQS15024.1 hypothetical protein [Reyranella sp.]HQT10833.1 hypothetical protein [Reyranella sp.]
MSNLTVASFWVYRPEEHPHAANYPAMLEILQRSCDRLGARHILLTDHATADAGLVPVGIEHYASDLPRNVMQATTQAQAHFLENAPAWFGDVLFVGADSILLQDPRPHLPDADLCVTSRRPRPHLDAINNGFMYIRRRALGQVSALYRRVADRCGTEWRDDQRALVVELDPVPMPPVIEERAGLRVAFLPMRRFNDCPRWPGDPCKDAVLLHFRGRQRKKMMFAWAKRQGLF